MKILVFLNEFPSQSQTFVLSQIVGTIDRGLSIDIAATKKPSIVGTSQDIQKYKLLENTLYLTHPPRRYLPRIISFLKLAIQNKIWNKPLIVLKALNFLKYGKEALNLNLPYYAIQFSNKKFDVIHCQFGTIAPLALKLKQVGAITGKLVVSYRGYDLVKQIQLKPGYYDSIINHVDLFLPVSDSLKKILIKIGAEENKVTVMHSGINLNNFTYQNQENNSNTALHVISIARLVEKKGLEYSIQAVSNLLSKGHDITYTIVGDGPLRSNLEDLVKELNIQNNVLFVGPKSHEDVLDLLTNADIFIAPSVTAKDGDQEGIPNVAKEAMAIGIPVISTDHAGIPELVIDKKTGFLVPEKDIDAISDYLLYIKDNINALSELKQNARSLISEEYDSKKLNDYLVELYQTL